MGPKVKATISRPRLICLLLVLITLLEYLPVAHHNFINLDDDLYITNNRVVQNGLTWAGFKWAFTTWRGSMWHPVTWLSHMLDCELFGLNAGAHHLVSVLFHSANAALAFLLLLKLTGAVWPSSLVAALFAWHPLFVESVAWVAERETVLCTFFLLVALLFYAGYAQTRPQGTEAMPGLPPKEYFLALVFFALSLMAKPMMVTLPFVMLLLDYWPLQRLPASPFRVRSLLCLVREKWPFFLLIVPVCLITFLAEHHDKLVTPLERLPLSPRICNAIRSYGLYLWKTVWPTKLCILYPYPPRDHLALSALASGAVLVPVTLLIWRARRRCPYLLVGWLWFLGMLVPVIGLVQIGYQAMNDHHAYGPLMGIFTAAAFGLAHLTARWNIGPVRLVATAGVVLAACLLASRHQLTFWRDDETLFTRALAVTRDNGPAHNNLGIALGVQGRVSEARQHFLEAIRLYPLWADPHNNLGNVLSRADDPAGALIEYSKAVQLKPNQPAMLINLGTTLADLGHLDEALLCLHRAAELTKLDSGYSRSHLLMAKILLRQGRDAEAIEECREALRLDPNNPEALTLTARVLAAEEDPGLRDGRAAVALAQRAAALFPNQPLFLDVLGMAYAEVGDFSRAQATASAAIQLAGTLGFTNLEAWRQRLDLYKKSQPWRESFLSTNTPPVKRGKD